MRLLAQAPAETYAAAGSFGGLILLFVWRLIKQDKRAVEEFVKPARRELAELRRDKRVCEKRLAFLIEILQQHSIRVPQSIWSHPELEDRIEHPEEYADDDD